MKKIILVIVIVISLLSCSSPVTYKWKVAVVYQNGDRDTINIQHTCKNELELYIQTSVKRGFGAAGVPACLTAYSWESGCRKTFVCGVRSFEILNEN